MGGQGGSERRIEVFVKIQKKKWGGWGSEGSGLGGQTGCERRIKVFGKIHFFFFFFFFWGGGTGEGRVGGGRMDLNEGLKFL